MDICSKQAGIILVSSKPNFKYKFKQADTSVNVKKEHCDKVLANSNFYEAGEEKQIIKEPTWEEELISLNGIGTKTAKDISLVHKTKESLLEALKNGSELPFDSDVDKILRGTFS